jgi:hypothetical protein
MKKTILFLFASVLLVLIAHAQPYRSMFGSDSTSWTFKWYNLDFGSTEVAYVSKDTVIGGLTYKKINYYNNGAPTAASAPCVLREDTLTGKVWFRSLGEDTADLLAFDFSLMPGDSFDIRNMQDGSGGAANYRKVDSVRMVNGVKYIYFDLPYDSWDPLAVVASEPYMIIEGIGSNMSPLWKQFIGGYRGHYLLCSSKNGVGTSYTNIRYAGNCSLPPLAIHDRQAASLQIKLVPNPVENTFAIITEDKNLVADIAVCDIVGKLLFRAEKVRPGEQGHRIDISKFNPGIYMVTVRDEHGINKTFRIIKQ